jgi:uncharacterized lipoprotein YehR (DUF1307 family)
MRKINRHFFALLSLVLVISLSACSNSDDNGDTGDDGGGSSTTAKLVGEWEYIGYQDYEENEFYENSDECYGENIKINADGTGIFTVENCNTTPVASAFNWEKMSGSNYKLLLMGENMTVKITFPDGNNKLYLQYSDEEGYADVYQKQ